jgi:hypothetical protein
MLIILSPPSPLRGPTRPHPFDSATSPSLPLRSRSRSPPKPQLFNHRVFAFEEKEGKGISFSLFGSRENLALFPFIFARL